MEKLNEIVRRQKDELDDGRKEAAAWQARVLRTQQDRNDAQVYCDYHHRHHLTSNL